MIEIFDVFPIFFLAMFVVVFGVIIYTAVKGAQERRANHAAPVLEVAATVTVKRPHVSSVVRQNRVEEVPAQNITTHTTYYVTFQVKSGDRMEFQVSDQAYGLLAEGDSGTLTFQGTRYLGFVRASQEKMGAY